MGIHCEINLHKSPDGVFRPGDTVTGKIRYVLNEVTAFNRVSISLRGRGKLYMEKMKHVNNRTYVESYNNKEDYVRQDCFIYNGEKGQAPFAIGTYEAQFSFSLPHRLPTSFSLSKYSGEYNVDSKIVYFVRIKFEKSNFFSFNKKFRKDITVISPVTPKFIAGPASFSKEKAVSQLFSSKKPIIKVTAYVQTCIIKPGGNFELEYEVANNSNVTIKGVKTKMIEAYYFWANCGKMVPLEDKIKDTRSKSGSIKSGEVKTIQVELMAPSDKVSIESSRMVVRDYIIRITVNLPMPHRDLVLDIPFQIGDIYGQTVAVMPNCSFTHEAAAVEAPPSYWEVMNEDTEKSEK